MMMMRERGEELRDRESELTCAAAFVEGGILETSDDACSICLDPFSNADPSTVTTCNHEYHLQCILEWCQRSRQCPMCWQLLSLKDPVSQELLDAVEHEKTFRIRRAQNASNPLLPFEDFDLHNDSINPDDLDLEEHIMQHLAGMATMGRAHRFARRDTSHNTSSARSHPNMSSCPPTSSASQGGNSPTLTVASSTSHIAADDEQLERPSQSTQVESDSPSARSATAPIMENKSLSFPQRNIARHPSIKYQQRAGPSEMHSFAESFKYRFSSMSSRCKESISKTTRGFKEKIWARKTSATDLGREVQQEVSAEVAGVSHVMEHLDPNGREEGGTASVSDDMEGSSRLGPASQSIDKNYGKSCSSGHIGVNLCASSSGSSRVAPQPLINESSSSMDTSTLKDVKDNSGGGINVQHTPAVYSP